GLFCGVPAFAVANPGSSRIPHEPLSNSLTLLFRGDCSDSALISVPARTVVFPLTLNFRPLRLRTICGAAAPLPPAPPPLGAAAPGPAAAPGAGAAPLAATPAPPRPPAPPPI